MQQEPPHRLPVTSRPLLQISKVSSVCYLPVFTPKKRKNHRNLKQTKQNNSYDMTFNLSPLKLHACAALHDAAFVNVWKQFP